MEEWKTIEPQIWKPEAEGDSIEGIYLFKEDKKENLSARYKLQNQKGDFLVWGCATLDDRMQSVQIGEEVRITFKERKDIGKGKTLKIFKVEVKRNIPKPTEEVVTNTDTQPLSI